MRLSFVFFFFSSRRRHTRLQGDWSSDVCSSDLASSQPSHPFGKWVYDNLGYRKIAMIGYDFAFGWEVAAGFQRTCEEAGGQVLQKLWPPLGTADFAPYITRLRRDVDAIYAVFSGADALQFAKPLQESGLRATLPLIGRGTPPDGPRPRSLRGPPPRGA